MVKISDIVKVKTSESLKWTSWSLPAAALCSGGLSGNTNLKDQKVNDQMIINESPVVLIHSPVQV